MKKKILLIMAIFVCCLVLTGCMKKTGTAKAYQVIYKDYIGVAEVTVKDNMIEDIELDEYFLPHVWSRVVVAEEEYPDDIIHVSGIFYAKYISIDGVVFTAQHRSGGITIDDVVYSNQIIKYTSASIEDLYVYLRDSEDGCEWYVNAVDEQKVFVCNEAGVKLTTYLSANTLGYSKQEGKYWTGASYPLGWKGNIDALINSLKGKSIKAVTLIQGEADSETGQKYWSIGSIKTGATLVAAQEYYDLIQKAYDKIEKVKINK